MYVHTYYKYFKFTIYIYSPDFLQIYILDYNDTKKGGRMGWGIGGIWGHSSEPQRKTFFSSQKEKKILPWNFFRMGFSWNTCTYNRVKKRIFFPFYVVLCVSFILYPESKFQNIYLFSIWLMEQMAKSIENFYFIGPYRNGIDQFYIKTCTLSKLSD